MAQQPVLARTTLVQVLAADGTTWVEVEGKTQVSIDASQGETMADKSTYGNSGHNSNIKTSLGASMEISYLRLRDDITGVRATGQARIETLAGQLGAAGLGQVRLREEVDTFWSVWTEATFVVGSSTGGVNDLRNGSYTINRNVPATLVAV